MISRETYLQKLRQLKDQNLIKVVTGIRRSGKSTLLEAFKNELIESGVSKKNIVFMNFEEREHLHLTDWSTLYDEIMKKLGSDKKKYVFLDEVQNVNDFEKLINGLFAKKNVDLYLPNTHWQIVKKKAWINCFVDTLTQAHFLKLLL
jgi:predicted AAA+ superfamily ATPase